VVETIVHPFHKAQLSELEPLLAQLPAMTRNFGYAGALPDAHHVVEAVVRESGNEACLMEAPVARACSSGPPARPGLRWPLGSGVCPSLALRGAPPPCPPSTPLLAGSTADCRAPRAWRRPRRSPRARMMGPARRRKPHVASGRWEQPPRDAAPPRPLRGPRRAPAGRSARPWTRSGRTPPILIVASRAPRMFEELVDLLVHVYLLGVCSVLISWASSPPAALR